MEHLDLAGVITSTPINWTIPLFDQQDAIYLSTSRQMLEPILEETSEDEERALNSWNQYDQSTTTNFWRDSTSESETGSVIRIETNKDSDSISERDFACPAKRARRSDEFIRELQQNLPSNTQYSTYQCQPNSLDDTVILRRPHSQRPDYVSESSINSLERFLALEAAARDSLGTAASMQRNSTGSTRRFDDFYPEADSLSYQSLSRSSSLIQFESLERQMLLQDQHASMSSLGNSSPSLLSFDGGNNTGSNSGSNSGNNSRRGSQNSLLKRYESSDGRLHQTYYGLDKLNFDEDETATIAPPQRQRLVFFGANSKTNMAIDESIETASGGESKSESESESSSGSDTGSGNSVLNSTKPSAEDLSDAATSGKSIRITAFHRAGKNSAENLSEDSGYCEPSNLRRSKSKSIPKNFEKFCEEEEEYGQYSFEQQEPLAMHSKTKRHDSADAIHKDKDNDDEDDDVCQPKIKDTTFPVMMESVVGVPASAADRSATSTLLPPSPALSPHRPLLETSFDEPMYTISADSPPPSITSNMRVKNSPIRDTTSTTATTTTGTTTATTSTNIERVRRPIAHSPSPAASDISARSSTSTTPSTCASAASAASFTWYAPTQMHSQANEPHREAFFDEDDSVDGAKNNTHREFSSESFPLRNSLPDLREAFGSTTEETFFYYKPQRPTNGYVLEHTATHCTEATGGNFPEANKKSYGGRLLRLEGIGQRSDSSSQASASVSASASSSSSPTSTSTSSSSSATEHSDVTTDSALTTPETTRRRRSVGGYTSPGVGGELCALGTDYKQRVSSVPSELNKVGKKKRGNSRRYNKTSSEEESMSSETNSEAEDNFNVELNSLRRCCSWSERRQKYQDSTGKRRPHSLFGYMNASYQDLTQLDYSKKESVEDQQQNRSLMKRASGKMTEARKSAASADYENIICKGNFLLDELSEIYDRNASILNDKPADERHAALAPEEYEDDVLLDVKVIQKPLHSPRPPPRQRKHSNSSYSDLESGTDQEAQHIQLQIRKPPTRQKHGRKNELNTNSLTTELNDIPSFVKTFDQDPTNLRTSYAQSLEKCNFDTKELSSTDLTAQQTRSMPKRRFHLQANNSKKKNLVSSTPNLNAYDHGADDEAEFDDELFVSSAHTSMHQLPQGGVRAQKPLGILLPAGSRTSFSKEVSFCPVVSKYSWQEQSSEECNDQTKEQNEEKAEEEKSEKGDQMYAEIQRAQKEHKERKSNDDDDDLLCNDIDATLAYNTRENETIAGKHFSAEEDHNKEHIEEEVELSDDTSICARFIEELREHELAEEFKRHDDRSSTQQQAQITPTTPPTNIITSKKLVTSTGVEKSTTIITKRIVPSTSTEALAATATTGSEIGVPNTEVSHKTTFVSVTTTPEFKTYDPPRSNEIKKQQEDVSVVQNTSTIKTTTGHAPRPLSIQLPILSEPPVNRAHHILYASQQMLDNFEKREREAELQEQQQRRLKAVSANNLSSGGTMSKQQNRNSSVMESQNSLNNNNDMNKMKSKFKGDEKHPNSKGFLSRFAHGLRFSLRRNKKKQLQKEQEQLQQQEQQTRPEFVPELQFNVVKDNKKDKPTKSKPTKSNNATKNSSAAGKRGHSPDVIHIPLKGPLTTTAAGKRSTPNTTVDSSVVDSSVASINQHISDISNASTINVEERSNSQSTPTVEVAVTELPTPTIKLVTGKPPLPKQPPPPRTSSLPQNMAHAHQQRKQQQQQQYQQYTPAVAISTSFMSQPPQSTTGLPNHTFSDSCEDFLAAERSYYYDDFKNQLNSGMQANGCALASGPNGGIGGEHASLSSYVSSPSRASVSQKTQMFNNMQRGAAASNTTNNNSSTLGGARVAPMSHHHQHNAGKIGLIETNLDTHETIITGKTRSLVDIGPSQLKFVNAGGKRLNATSTGVGGDGVIMGHGGDNVLIYDDDDDDIDINGGGNVVVVVKSTTPAGQIASVRRPHKSMEFLLDKENQKNVLVCTADFFNSRNRELKIVYSQIIF